MTDQAIHLEGVTKAYPSFQLGKLDLAIPKGYITGFIGPNGSGKTTTMKLIMGLIHADQGRIQLLGQSMDQDAVAIKDQIGFVYAENPIPEYFKIKNLENIVKRAYSQWDSALFARYCDQFDLPVDQKIKDFSTGMKFKLALAIALSHQAHLIILDEPSSGLDPVVRREILNILQEEMLDGETTILISSHNTQELEQITDYIVFINQGQVVFNASALDISQRYRLVKGPLELLQEPDSQSLLEGVQVTPYHFTALSQEAQALKELYGQQVMIEEASLEDIMYHTVKGDSHESLDL
ncbi:ABC transporter ATP-binding protein [Aerococcus sp. UMB8487]|uniref:ABC transporter ATP-binding protein n=1 Tax=Aerococcus sp. UMB8487 TaxID=3046346 RepID=UPI0025503E81|nr:ABC transporter ATP-binding protein [Aerococcus sp. UMB8487]MDK6940668.1 ABC transporter ATP-binding protein [Aerococcus sp. UMB8487]